MRRLDPDLVTLHPFGCLVIATHDGRFLAAGVCTPEDNTHAILRRKKEGRSRRPLGAIVWSTETG